MTDPTPQVTQADVTFANHIIAGFRVISGQQWFADASADHWLAKDISRHRLATAAAPSDSGKVIVPREALDRVQIPESWSDNRPVTLLMNAGEIRKALAAAPAPEQPATKAVSVGEVERLRAELERSREDTRTIQRNTAIYRLEARAEAERANFRAAAAERALAVARTAFDAGIAALSSTSTTENGK